MRKLNIIAIKYQAEDAELKQMFSDMIEMYIEKKDKIKENYYRELYRKKFGEEYKPIKEFKSEPSLDKIYEKEDFKRYQDYIKYSDDLYRLKFKTYKSLLRNIKNPSIISDQLIDFHNSLGIETFFKPHRGTEEAWVSSGDTNKITYNPKYLNEPIWKEVIIHELGHILDNILGNPASYSKLFLHNRKSSVYDLSPIEIFADSFLNYSVSPKYLNAGWSAVYEYFNKKVPNYWKSKIRELIKMRSN